MFSLLKFIKKKYLITNLFLKIFIKISFLLSPFILQNLIDNATAGAYKNLIIYILISFLVLILTQILFYYEDILNGICETDFYLKIIEITKNNILYFDEKENTITDSKIHQHLGQNYEMIKDFAYSNPLISIVNLIYSVALLTMIFLYSKIIFFTVIILVPFFILITKIFEEKFENINEKWISTLENTRKYLVDLFNYRFLERSNANNLKQSEIICDEYKKSAKNKYRFESFFNNVLSYTGLNFLIFLTQAISAFQIYKGNLTVGGFAALSLLVSHFWSPTEFYVDLIKEYMSKKILIKNFIKFINIKKIEETTENINSIEVKNFKNPENIEKTSFNYYFNKPNIYLLLGDNGAGKTTLLKKIIGATKRFNGDIFINEKLKDNKIYKKIFFMDSQIYESEFLNNGIFLNSSMGQRKIYLLNLLKEIDADVFLLDEPTNYLQEDKKEILIEILDYLKKQNKIIIVVTHDLTLISKKEYIKLYI